MEANPFPELTEKCQNFKNYLQNSFQVENYGNFVGAYKFSLDEINALVAAATNEYGTPTHLRVYYGCDVQGENHRLFLAVLDANDNVLQAQTIEENNLQQQASKSMLMESTLTATASLAADRDKCPPGCIADAILRPVFNS